MFQHLIQGGIWFTIPIFILYAVVLVMTMFLFFRMTPEKKNQKARPVAETILFLGSFAFLWGVLGQVIGIMQAMDAIQEAGDISVGLIAGGFKVSLIAPVYGFVLFIFSFLVWFIQRKMSKQK